MRKNLVNSATITMLLMLSVLVIFAQNNTAQMNDVEANRALEALNIEGFNNADWDTVAETVSEDFVLYQPLSQEPIVGQEALIGFFQSFHDAMPDINHPNVNVILAEDEWVVVLMPLIATFENEMMGVPPTGEPIMMYFLNFWHVEDGVMSEAYFHFDTLDLLGQMGAIPADPDAPVIERSVDEMPIEIHSEDADPAANRELILELIETTVNTHDLDLVPEYFSEDWVAHARGDVHNTAYNGHEGVIAWAGDVYNFLPDFEMLLDEALVVAEGDLVALRWVGVGTHTGEVPGIPATGNEVYISGAWLNRVEDGKIAETWYVLDTLGFMAQIGVIPEPE